MCGSGEGFLIASLQTGDEVNIAAGYGNPPAEIDRHEIIISVSGFSALTNMGTRLVCDDEEGVTPTGNRFEPETYEVTPEAQDLLTQARAFFGPAELYGAWFDNELSVE